MVVEPGAFRMEFAGRSLHQAAANIADYAQTAVPHSPQTSAAPASKYGDNDA